MQQVRLVTILFLQSKLSWSQKKSLSDSFLLLNSENFTKGLGGFMEKCPQFKAAGMCNEAKYFFQLPYVFQIIQPL